MKLTQRGKVVLWIVVLVVGYLAATVPAFWWTDNPMPL